MLCTVSSITMQFRIRAARYFVDLAIRRKEKLGRPRCYHGEATLRGPPSPPLLAPADRVCVCAGFVVAGGQVADRAALRNAEGEKLPSFCSVRDEMASRIEELGARSNDEIPPQ